VPTRNGFEREVVRNQRQRLGLRDCILGEGSCARTEHLVTRAKLRHVRAHGLDDPGDSRSDHPLSGKSDLNIGRMTFGFPRTP
jgi:hypothetical protein